VYVRLVKALDDITAAVISRSYRRCRRRFLRSKCNTRHL